jgi:predicted DNA-binding transcriptional regulator AlpA
VSDELEQLLTGADVARLLELSRERVRQLRKQPGFPEPLGRVGNYVVWRRADIETWARAAGRIK